MKKLQLEDLSKKLGYSKTLISMVLNGKGTHYGISEKTQALVTEAVSKLNYAPNKIAKALRTGKSNFIGLIIPDISNPFYSTIAKNIEHILHENKYNLLVCNTEENEEKEKSLVDTMINQIGVDGLIIASTFKKSEFYEQTRFSKTPLVFVDRILPLFNSNFVVIDNYGGAVKITTHLIKQGCKNIACFTISPSYISTINDRLNGFKDTLKNHTLSVNETIIKEIHFETIQKDVSIYFNEFLNNKPPIDGIFVLNNNIAVAVLNELKNPKYKKFVNLKIACFDDIELFNLIDKPVISMSQPIHEIGKTSSLLLMDVINKNQLNKSNVTLSPTLIIR